MAKSSAQRLEYIMTLNAREWNTVQAEMQKRANETAEAYNKMKSRIAEIKEALKTATDPAQISALHSELGKLTSDIGGAKNAMETWKKAVQELPQGVDKVTAAMNRLASGGTLSMKQYQEAIKAAEKQLQNFGNSRNTGKSGYTQADMDRLRTFISTAKEQIAVLQSGWLKSEEMIRHAGATSVEQGQRMLTALAQMRAVTNKNATIMIDGQSVNKIEAIDAAINKTNADMERLKVNSSDLNRVFAIGKSAMANNGRALTGSITGSINELERLRATTIAAMNSTDQSTAKGIKKYAYLQNALRNLEREIAKAGISQQRYNAIISQLGSGGKAKATLFELQQVVKVLEKEMQHLVADTDAFNKKAMQLRNARARMKELTDATKMQVNALDNAISRLKTYVMVYMGFQALLMRMRTFFSDTLALSDSLSDIQKRTRLTNDAIKEISKTIDSFDTRTSQSQLHELAATAGLLGLKSKQDIIGFTSAADKMSVALVELGSDGAAQLMKIATLTGDVAQYGTEKALNKTASAINELTAASAASAGPMVNFISRMGAVGSQANLTMGDLAGIGATLDALGQPIELSATAMNRFIMALKGNTDGIATTLDIPLTTLENLMSAGKTMEAIILVLQKMGESEKGVAGLSAVFDEMGSEGVRLKQTISSLVGNVDFLKKQVNLSNKAFNEGVSVLNEYNMKNNNAAAIMERTGNMLHEYFINAEGAESLKKLATILYNIVEVLIKALPAIGGIVRAWISYKAVIIATTFQQSKLYAAMSASFLGNVIKMGIASVTLGIAKLRGATDAAARASERLNAAMKAASMSNVWSIIATAALTAVSYIIDFGNETSKASEELKGINHAAEDFAKAQDAIKHTVDTNKDVQDELVYLQHLINNLRLAKEGTDEWKQARAALQEKYGDQLKNVADEIRELKNLGDNYATIIHYINKTDDAAKKRTLIDNLYECEKNSISAQEALARLTNQDEGYEKQLDITRNAIDKETAARNLAIEACDSDTQALASNITMLKDAAQAEKILRSEIIQTARARSKQAAIEQEYNAIQDVVDELMKEAGDQATNGRNAFTNLWYGSAGTVVPKALWNAYSNDIRTYVMGGPKSATLDAFIKTFEETQYTVGTLIQSGGRTMRNDFNEIDNMIENARRAVAERMGNIERISNWDIGGKTSGAGNGGGSETSWMATGWNEANYKKEVRETLDKRSSLLKAEWNKYANGSDMSNFNIFTGQNFQDSDGKTAYENARDWVQTQTKAMQKAAKERGWTLDGSWVWPSDKSASEARRRENKEKKEMEDMMKGMLAQLETYYNERKRIEEQNRADGLIDEVEKNRRLEKIEYEHQMAAHDLRWDFVKTESKEFENLDLALVEKIYGDPKDATKNLNKLRALFAKFGQTELSEIVMKASENYLAATQITAKQTEEYRKQLMEYDNIAKYMNDIATDSNKSNLLMIGWETDGTDYQTVLMKRMKMLFMLVQNAYKMNADDMKAFMQKEGFGEWAKSIFDNPDKEVQLLFMNKLQDYFDKFEDTVKKEATKLKKRIEMEMDTVIGKDGLSFNERQKLQLARAENRVGASSYVEDIAYFGTGERFDGQDQQNDVELQAIKTKIQLTQDYINVMEERYKKEMELAEAELARAEAEKNQTDIATAQARIEALKSEQIELVASKTKEMAELQQEEFDQVVKNASSLQGKLSPYMDMMNDFAESFGENVFGSKEDRQQAARDLLITFVKTTSQMLTQWLVYISTKKIYNSIETSMEEAKNAQILLSYVRTQAAILSTDVNTMVARLKLEGIQTEADLAAKGAMGLGTEVASKGLIGLAIGAAITVAMTALSSMIVSKIKNASNEAASVAGSSGRMATGMLTYAEGKYPVLGNDGRMYDAKYEGRGMKTGVYRGGAHFGIFSEKEPEMVLSGPTTRAVLNEPLIANAIKVIDMYGRLPQDFFSRRTMRTHADGTVGQFVIPEMPASQQGVENGEMYARLAETMERMNEQLSRGITARINMYGDGGLDESIARRDRYNARNARRHN